jgi:hypothetical protein
MKSLRLKPIEAQNARRSSAWVSYLRQPWSVLGINDSLAIERRGGRGGGGPPMPVRPVDRGQRLWNKGLLIGQKKPLEPKHVWSIRVRLEIARSRRDLAIFNLAIDSKLRACDLVKLRLDDICGEPMFGTEQRSSKRRQVGQSSSRSRSSRGAPLKPGCLGPGQRAPDISSQADCTQAPTYPPANMPGWFIVGLKASA